MKIDLIRHRVFNDLRSDIMSCGLRPGEELREAELAKRYGVSKSPIRAALQKLEFEGLIEIEARRGHRVAPISVSDAEDILDLRTILESGAIRRLVTEGTDETLTQLDRYREADMTNLEAFAQYNRNFHIGLGELSGNRRLADHMRRVMENYDRLCLVSLTSTRSERENLERALADHNEIIDAIQSRNSAAAIRRSTRHTKHSRAQIMRMLDSRPIIG